MCQCLKPNFGVYFIRVYFESEVPWKGDIGPFRAYYAIALSVEPHSRSFAPTTRGMAARSGGSSPGGPSCRT